MNREIHQQEVLVERTLEQYCEWLLDSRPYVMGSIQFACDQGVPGPTEESQTMSEIRVWDPEFDVAATSFTAESVQEAANMYVSKWMREEGDDPDVEEMELKASFGEFEFDIWVTIDRHPSVTCTVRQVK